IIAKRKLNVNSSNPKTKTAFFLLKSNGYTYIISFGENPLIFNRKNEAHNILINKDFSYLI
ncbi:hypothetical protein AC573_07705, partial [Mannheimia haemolytica]|uniref:hypothetical protein n=1 Tax=Mannheimia haemolytica TaxID=75985 RepID=UPI0007912C8B